MLDGADVDQRRELAFFFQADDGIRDLVRSRGLGDVYKRQVGCCTRRTAFGVTTTPLRPRDFEWAERSP